MGKRMFDDNHKYNSAIGAHVKGNTPKREVPYYEKNRSPVGQLQGRSVHRKASNMFSQYDTSAIQPKKGKTKLAVILVIVILAVLAVIVAGPVMHLFGDAPAPQRTDVTAGVEVDVTIPEGASTTQIAGILYDAGVVNDGNDFIKAAKAADADSSLKPGNYHLTTLMPDEDVVAALVEGPDVYGTKLTIPEGETVAETAAIVESKLGIPADDFLAVVYSADQYVEAYPFLEGVYNNSMEGYLFPKTYDVPDGATADSVARMMLDQFASEMKSAGLMVDNQLVTSESTSDLTLQQAVIVGSLIQKETSEISEMPTIASVIYNRFYQGIALQIDATVVYALGDNYTGGVVTYDDLAVDSPYNTYLNQGLTPGPICSPGIDAIKAACNPATTDYLYYLAPSGSTTHQFFEDYDSFLAAKGA